MIVSRGNVSFDFSDYIVENLNNYTQSYCNRLTTFTDFSHYYSDDFCIIYQKFLDDFIHKEFFSKKFNMEIYSITHSVQLPQSLNNWHVDSFHKLKSQNLKNLVRVNVFMEDWKIGHVLQTEKGNLINWKKGDYIMWDCNEPHLAANLGKEPKHTMQFSGVYLGT